MTNDPIDRYRLRRPDGVATPALVVYPKLIDVNLARLVGRARDPERLRLHVKTHKTPQIVERALAFGVAKHKCATLAEAAMLAAVGAADIVIAYPLVGPNIARFVALVERYPNVRFRPIADHADPLAHLANAVNQRGHAVEVLLDLDVGMGRTGVAPGPAALDLYGRLATTPGVAPGGLHIYDGHVNDEDAAIRRARAAKIVEELLPFIEKIDGLGLPIPRMVCGGTGTFPFWSEQAQTDRRVECSPGTLVLNDAGYARKYADLDFAPAAALLTRIVSKPKPNRLTLDLGSKALASDSAVSERVCLLDLPDAVIVSQSEEHLVVESPRAEAFAAGQMLYGWPNHICPTVALYPFLLVVEEGEVTGHWRVAARDRD